MTWWCMTILSNADSDFLKSLSARVILIDFGHVAKIFKRPKNREDSSDFDDFLTKTIAPTRSRFRKNLARRSRRKRRTTSRKRRKISRMRRGRWHGGATKILLDTYKNSTAICNDMFEHLDLETLGYLTHLNQYMTWKHLATTWKHLATSWKHLATPPHC